MQETKCPFCGEKVYLGLDRCPYCAETLPDNLEPINEEGTAGSSNQGPQQNTYGQDQQQNAYGQDQQQDGPRSGYTWNRQDSYSQGPQQTYGPDPQQQYGQAPYGYPPGYQYPQPIPKMPFVKAIKTCLVEKYSTFTGRARRSEFWWFYLAQTILTYILSRAVSLTSSYSLSDLSGNSGELFGIAWDSMGSMLTNPVWWLSVVVWLGLLIPNLAVICRRLHDTGKSGWWQMIFIGSVLLFYLAIFLNPKVWLVYPILFFVMLAALIVMIVWLCKDSDPKPNKWGPSPKYDGLNQQY